MTDQDLQAVQSKINELEAASADLREAVHLGIEQSREIMAGVRQGQAQMRAIDAHLAPLREARGKMVAELNAEARRQAEEQARDEAAAKPPEPPAKSPLEVLSEQVANLTDIVLSRG